MDEQSFRTMDETERDVLMRLLSFDFPGRDGLAEQSSRCSVATIAAPGHLVFKVHAPTQVSSVKYNIPVEGESVDKDGVPVYFLLHVKDGRLHRLEWYKADSSQIVKMPTARAIRVFARE